MHLEASPPPKIPSQHRPLVPRADFRTNLGRISLSHRFVMAPRMETDHAPAASTIAPACFSVADSLGHSLKEIVSRARPHGCPHANWSARSNRHIGSSSLQVLLADDTYGNRRLIEQILRHEGHRVVAVDNGREAVDSAMNQNWNIILMDLQMPLMNGWQAAEAIRLHELEAGKSAPVPIVAISAFTAPGNLEHCRQAGMNGFLNKPIDPQALIKVVERHGYPLRVLS